MKCDFDGHCEISLNTRHVCSYCRLLKCFKSGMQTEMFRSSLPKKKKTSEQRRLIRKLVPTTTASVRLNQAEQVRLFDSPTHLFDHCQYGRNLKK